jgi:outer membrane protein assembly factor BamB
VHCLDARTGLPHWVHDLLAPAWGSPLIADGKVYIGDEDGDVTVFQHGRDKKILSTINVEHAVYSTPIVANNVLYIASRTTLLAIGPKE